MTGEKIRYYRKLNGLSQEELGQKLMVSRQTISLWETDQAMPTVDNLIRLREIFGVTVDELLNGAPPTSAAEQPKERLVYSYEAAQIKVMHRALLYPHIKRIVFFVLLLMGAILLQFETKSPFILGVVSVLLLLCFFNLLHQHKQNKRTEQRLLQTTYVCELYEDRLRIQIRHTDLNEYNIPLSEIKQVRDVGDFYTFPYQRLFFSIPKAQLSETSALHALLLNAPKSKVIHPRHDALSLLSWILFIVSIMSVYGAMFASLLLGDDPTLLWVSFLFIPIPAASVIFGFINKKKRVGALKNIIIGFIMISLLALMGCLSLVFRTVYDNNKEQLAEIEQICSIDLPDRFKIQTMDYSNSAGNATAEQIHSISIVTLDEAAAASFRITAEKDKRWLETLPTNLRSLLPMMHLAKGNGITLIYNVDLDEYNTLPAKDGRYHFICLTYISSTDTIHITDYDMLFKK